MTVLNRQLKHYQRIARQNLDKFRLVAKDMQTDSQYQLADSSWQSFVDDEKRLRRFADNVDDVASILGFSREINRNLSYEALVEKVIHRFAELDLAEHIIRELAIDKSTTKLQKLPEGATQKCDFKYLGRQTYYFESKYTKNISPSNITTIAKDALQQIRTSIDGHGIGCIWIFTYEQPQDPMTFQREVLSVKYTLINSGIDFKLNVQVYGRGLYGDATAI